MDLHVSYTIQLYEVQVLSGLIGHLNAVFFLFVFFLSLLSFFAIGEVCFQILASKLRFSVLSVFRNIFTGYVVSIVLYSLIKTSGVTINVLFLLLFVFCGIEYKRIRESIPVPVKIANPPQVAGVIIVCAAGLFLVFIWSWSCITSNDPDFVFNYDTLDYSFYSRVAKSLGDTGQENGFTFLNTIDSYYHGPEPYHYFDLWGGSLVASVFSINHFVALRLIVYPTFYFLVFLSFTSLVQNGYAKILLGLCLLFTGGLYLTFYESNAFLSSLRDIRYSLVTPTVGKLSYFYVFFAASYLLFQSRFYLMSTLVLLGLPIANIITLPIIAAILLIALLSRFFGGLPKADFQRIAIYSVSTMIGLIAFYVLFKKSAIGLTGAQISSPLSTLMSNLEVPMLGVRFNILAGGLLHLAILYFPLLLFILISAFCLSVNLWKSRGILGFSLLFIGSSLLLWAILFKELNSSQVFTNSSISLLNFVAAILLINIYNESKGNKYVLLGFVIYFSFRIYNGINLVLPSKGLAHSPEYLREISRLVHEKTLLRGASIKDSSILATPFEKYNALYPLGDYLGLMNDNIVVLNIGDFNTPIDSTSVLNRDRSLKAIQSGIFYRYVKNRLAHDSIGMDIERFQKSFIKEFGVQFLILSRGSSKSLESMKAKDGVITDSLTGEHFVILNPAWPE